MNKSVVKTAPNGDFKEISIHMPEWEATFLKWVRQRERLKYDLYTMPNISQKIEAELDRNNYADLMLENTDWHFLVPRSA